nr:immunoglobulin heavy chain junction region [Mus musculus]
CAREGPGAMDYW